MLLLACTLALTAALVLLLLLTRTGRWNGQRENAQLLTLVNAAHPLPERQNREYTLLDDGQMVDQRCAGDLQLMLADCRAAGGEPVIARALVTRAEQADLFAAELAVQLARGLEEEQARAAAARAVPPPGQSEHELGLAVDLRDEGDTAELTQRWLAENSWRYGFILRYPEGKSEITGRDGNPWHFRYVGQEAARQIVELDITLEEYIELFYS